MKTPSEIDEYLIFDNYTKELITLVIKHEKKKINLTAQTTLNTNEKKKKTKIYHDLFLNRKLIYTYKLFSAKINRSHL